MNPYANLYLQVDKQHSRDLARTYRNAQSGWAHPDFPDGPDFQPVRPLRKSRIRAALRGLRVHAA
jgi:hypothetical protein